MAPPWMTRVESSEMAAQISSDNQDFAVPGSPTSMAPRWVAREITTRVTMSLGATNLGVVPSSGLPSTKASTPFGDSIQPGGRG